MNIFCAFRRAIAARAILLTLSFGANGAFAQNPAPLDNPNLQVHGSNLIDAMALLPDGSMIFSGIFDLVNGQPRYGMAKLKADGTLDPNWSVCTTGRVYALAGDGNGNVYLGGSFTRIGADWLACMQNQNLLVTRNHVAKIKTDGTLDPNWDPNANGDVSALATDGNGNVYAGGSFTNVGGSARNQIAKLKANGASDANWSPSLVGYVHTLMPDANGNVYAGGDGLFIDGQSRNGIAKLNADGTVDANWIPSAGALDYVSAIAVDGSNHLYVGGSFDSMGGQTRSRIAKLNADGTADAGWNPNVGISSGSSSVNALVLDGTGHLYVGGSFNSIGGQTRNNIAKLNADGTADASWNPGADDYVQTLALRGFGVYAGGPFTQIGGQPRRLVAALPASDQIFVDGFDP